MTTSSVHKYRSRKHRCRRYVARYLYCIEGEVEIGGRKTLIQNEVTEENRYITAVSPKQARSLLAQRFLNIFGVKIYIGDAKIHELHKLPPNFPKVASK